MKTVFLIVFLTSFTSAFSQDTTKVEQYCEVVATDRLLSNKVTIDINYGEERSIWKSHRLKEEGGKLKKFNSVIDAVNYLGKNGWKLVNAFPLSEGNGPTVYHYIFKKEFVKSDIE